MLYFGAQQRTRILQELEESASNQIVTSAREFEGLSICALPATDITKPWMSPTTGVASVSVTSSPAAILALLRESGTSVVDKLEKQKIAAAGVQRPFICHFPMSSW